MSVRMVLLYGQRHVLAASYQCSKAARLLR